MTTVPPTWESSLPLPGRPEDPQAALPVGVPGPCVQTGGAGGSGGHGAGGPRLRSWHDQRTVFARPCLSHPHPRSREPRYLVPLVTAALLPLLEVGTAPRAGLDSASRRSAHPTHLHRREGAKGTAARLPLALSGGRRSPAPWVGEPLGDLSKGGAEGRLPGEQRHNREAPGWGHAPSMGLSCPPPWAPSSRFYLHCAAPTVKHCISKFTGYSASLTLSAGCCLPSAQHYRRLKCPGG